MKYGIIANPVSGRYSLDDKRKILKEVASILEDVTIAGLDTKSPEELVECACELSQKVGILIVAGGDGTFFQIMNHVPNEVPLGYLSFGSGNVIRYTFNLPRSPLENARLIHTGTEHFVDAISCDGKTKSLFASIGIDANILLDRNRYVEKNMLGFKAYVLATFKNLFGVYVHPDLRASIDRQEMVFPNVLTAAITKFPYYGYGFKTVPQAKYDDGYLHILVLNTGPFGALYALATSLMGGNRAGAYYKSKEISITSSTEQLLQQNGDPEKEKRTDFSFKVLPKELKLIF